VVTVEPVAEGDDIDRALARERAASEAAADTENRERDDDDDGTRETDVESDRAS